MQNLKVIFHLNGTDSWSKTIRNIQNLLKYLNSQNTLNDNLIEILINGEAVKMLKDNGKNLLELNNLGVNISVCNNSLENFKIYKF